MKCRLGHDGKVKFTLTIMNSLLLLAVHCICTCQVDIKYTTPSAAGHYYADHLPVLGTQ